MSNVKVKSYRDLHVWQRSVQFAVEIYRVTRGFPKHELYGGLTDQIRGVQRSRSLPTSPKGRSAIPSECLRITWTSPWVQQQNWAPSYSSLARSAICRQRITGG